MRDVITIIIIVIVMTGSTVDTISLAPVYWNHSNPM